MVSSFTISRGSNIIKTLAVFLSFTFSLCWPHFQVGSPYMVTNMAYLILTFSFSKFKRGVYFLITPAKVLGRGSTGQIWVICSLLNKSLWSRQKGTRMGWAWGMCPLQSWGQASAPPKSNGLQMGNGWDPK